MSSYRNKPLQTVGLPPGIPYIIGNEAAERFSFYGMKSILLVFMTTYLIQPDGGLDTFSIKEAEAWNHLFVASAYFFPIAGGILADAFLGKYLTIIILSLVYCLGHASLAFMGYSGDTRMWLFAGLALIAIGSGGIKPCVSSHVGDQFSSGNKNLLSKVFGWFYFSINLGAFLSGLLTPFLLEARNSFGSFGGKVYPYVEFLVGEKKQDEIIFGVHYAFGLPGVLMALATLFFWLGRKDFAHIPPRGLIYFRETFSFQSLRPIFRLTLIFSFVIMFWALFDQIGTTWQIQARSLDRVLPDWVPFFGGKEMLASQVAAVWNPLFILILIPIFSFYIYPFISRFLNLTALRKMSIGFWVMGFAFAIVSVLQHFIDIGTFPSVGWQILGCFFLTASEVMISITCLEFAYTQAPKNMKSLVMAFFLLTVSLGNFLTSQVKFLMVDSDGSSKMTESQELWFWTFLILITAFAFRYVAKNYKTVEHLHDA
jgi:POT family proton-dependent oligopeptide transporter